MTTDTLNRSGPDDGRDDLEDLLPFYAAGVTTDAENAAIEARLATDAEFARRLSLAQEELDEAVSLAEAGPTPSAGLAMRLMDRIEAEAPRRDRVANPGLLARFGAWLAEQSAPRLGLAAVAAAAVLAVQAGFIGTLLVGAPSEGPQYQTASSGQQAVAGPGALVQFAPGITLADVEAFLARHKVVIVEGPVAGGLYRLRLPSGLTPAAAVTAFKGDPAVRLAVPTN
jgi:hypothetical protein